VPNTFLYYLTYCYRITIFFLLSNFSKRPSPRRRPAFAAILKKIQSGKRVRLCYLCFLNGIRKILYCYHNCISTHASLLNFPLKVRFNFFLNSLVETLTHCHYTLKLLPTPSILPRHLPQRRPVWALHMPVSILVLMDAPQKPRRPR
jgi:hypothetical protein